MFQDLGSYVDAIAFIVLGLSTAVTAPKILGAAHDHRDVRWVRAGGILLIIVGAGLMLTQFLRGD